MSFISVWAPDNSFCILNRKCKIALPNKSRKEKRDDPAMTASAEALVFPGTERGKCIGLAGPQGLRPWHPPARPARAAGASLLQPSPDSYSSFLYSGISLAGEQEGQSVALRSGRWLGRWEYPSVPDASDCCGGILFLLTPQNPRWPRDAVRISVLLLLLSKPWHSWETCVLNNGYF